MTLLSDQLYDSAKEWMAHNNEMDATTIIPLATHLMSAAQKMSAPGNGLEKKNAVINVVKRLINDTVSEDKRNTLLTLVDSILSPAIDAIVTLSSSGALRKWWKQVKKVCCCCL
jgi:hypothetical protein